jgi:apolipoprotein N-acyltransferase
MGLIIGVTVLLILVSALLYLLCRGINTRWLRPYIGLALIGLLIAGMGLLLGLISTEIEDYFLLAAKGVIAFTGIMLCLRLIRLVAKRFIVRH